MRSVPPKKGKEKDFWSEGCRKRRGGKKVSHVLDEGREVCFLKKIEKRNLVLRQAANGEKGGDKRGGKKGGIYDLESRIFTI